MINGLTLYLLLLSCMFGPAHAIDNLSLKYSTYMGSTSLHDEIYIDVDSTNNYYIAGKVDASSTMPNIAGGFGDPNHPFAQSFIYKYSKSHVLQYSAFFVDTTISGISVDSENRVYFTGNSSRPIPGCAKYGTFLARLSVDGTSIDFCNTEDVKYSYLSPKDITLDSQGNVYLTGEIFSSNETPSGFQPTPGTFTNSHVLQDAYVFKFDPDGHLLMSLNFGGSGNDTGYALKVGGDGTIYVAGGTDSNDFPLASKLGNGQDTFFVKISNDGSMLLFSDVFGGTDADVGLNLSIDTINNVYISGNTYSSDYPVTNNPLQSQFTGVVSGFVTKYSADNAIQYSTYIGGNSTIQDMDIDNLGNTYLSGSVFSADYSTTVNAFQVAYPLTRINGFFTKLSSDGDEILYSSFLGGDGQIVGFSDGALSVTRAIKVSPNGAIILGGYTNATRFPVTRDAQQETLNHNHGDLFYSTFEVSPLMMKTPVSIETMTYGIDYMQQFEVEGGVPPYTWSMDSRFNVDGINFNDTGLLSGILTPWSLTLDQTYTVSEVGISFSWLPFRVSVSDQNGNQTTQEFLSFFNYQPIADAGDDLLVIGPATVTLDGGNSHDYGYDFSYSWTQVSGLATSLSDADTPTPSLYVPNTDAVLIFELTVTDEWGISDKDQVAINIDDEDYVLFGSTRSGAGLFFNSPLLEFAFFVLLIVKGRSAQRSRNKGRL